MPDTHTPSASSLADAAVAASKAGNWAAAARFWAEFCVLQPGHIGGLAQKILALDASGERDQADAEIAAAMERLPGEFDLFAAWARLSAARQNWPQALARWCAARARFPDRAAGLQGQLTVLRDMQLLDEAEAILAVEWPRFATSFEIATTAAGMAAARRDWPEVEARWRAVRKGWPDRQGGYLDGAAALRTLGRLDEAEALLNEARGRFGDTTGLMAGLAQIAEARRDWQTAVVCWRAAAEAAPGSVGPQMSVLHNLLKLGEEAEVDARLAEIAERFPDRHEVLSFKAMRAEARRAWAEALSLWRQAASLAPDRVALQAHIADALRRMEFLEDAEAVLKEVLPLHPTNTRLLTSFAQIAQSRCDWPEAKRRWERLLELEPANHGAQLQLGVIAYQMSGMETDSLSDETAAARPAGHGSKGKTPSVKPIEGPWDAARLSLRDMFMKLENLGDNCEFGLVQRRFGAEPLGLMRWTVTSIRMLTKVLDEDLGGVGLPEHTRIELRSGDEYYTSDTRYGMRMHTFMHREQIKADVLLAKLCKRIQYLRGKMLDDLKLGNQKLYVYKSLLGYQPGDIETLHTSLQRLGTNTLLCVKLADDAHPDGTVEQVSATLLIGYIKRFNNDGGTWLNTEFDSWATISSKAHHLWQAQLERDAERAA